MVVNNACGQASSPEALLVVGLEPVLNITRTGANAVLTWRTPDYRLQGATSLGSQVIWFDQRVPRDAHRQRRLQRQ